jgi:hypothetical protein
MTVDRLAAAVLNNARWCDAVCRAHGVPTSWQDDWWTAGRRTPVYYPDAITLRPSASFDRAAELIEAGPDGSVKDSWADLDLRSYGYQLLFEAHWITREPGEAPTGETSDWTTIGTADELAEWSAAGGLVGTFPPALLQDPAIRFVAERVDGRIIAGGIGNADDAAVGVSNVFGEQPWDGLVAAIERLFPGRPLVGYEQPNGLAEPASEGFRIVGPLRIWRTPG